MQAILTAHRHTREKLGKTWSLDKQKALIISLVITLTTMVVEFISSFLTGSLMLFSDAIHMLSHAASLLISLLAIMLAVRIKSKRLPFGLKRLEPLAAFINGISLVFFVAYIGYEAFIRLIDPQIIQTSSTLMVAIIGLAVNLITAFILGLAGLEDLNTRSVFLHMLADTFSSIAIIAGAITIKYTGWMILDPILSLVVAIIIGKWGYDLLKESGKILLNVTPEHINSDKIAEDLYGRFDTIVSVEEVKVWEIANGESAAIIKLKVFPGEVYEYKRIKREIKQRLEKKFGISQLSVEFDW